MNHMAQKHHKSTFDPEANQEREVKEVATKLRHLGPVAKAEVVNDVMTHQLGKHVAGFTNFLRDQSVIGIGIGLVLGTQVKAVVDQIMQSFVNPLTRLLPGEHTLSAQIVHVHWNGRSADVGWGAIVYSLFTLIVVLILVYAIFKMLKLDRFAKKK